MSWLQKWEPEDPQFWQSTGSSIAWRTLIFTTISLVLSFATWFTMSAVVVRLPQIGFKFDTMQLFWLAAMPGLAAGALRTIHSFLIPIFGTRLTISVATFIKLLPCVGIAYAVMHPETPFWFFLLFAFFSGFGGGDFSSFMPSSSLFFPKRLQGLAMGIQAGVGNFGVGLTQFVTPWIIGFAAFGAIAGGSQVFTKADTIKQIEVTKDAGVVKDVVFKDPALASMLAVTKDANGAITDVTAAAGDAAKDVKVEIKREGTVLKDVQVKKVTRKPIWVQNALLWYVPFLVILTVLCALFLRSVPIRASIKDQFDIVSDKHGWFCTITYIMTFGSFAGFSAAFPLLIKTVYGGFPNAPDPLKYAFYGPMIGGAVRVIFGAPSDKFGGSILIQITGAAMILGCIFLVAMGLLTPTSLDQFPMFVAGMLWLFFWAGVGNAATFRQYPIVFAYSARKGAQALGWTGAWAAYGPFIFALLIGASIARTGSPNTFFIGAAVFYVIASLLNWWYYTRPGAERGDWGTKWGTWWDSAKDTWTATK